MMVAAEWGTGQVFWSMLWFFLWFIWLWILITVLADIFRSPDLGGWGKTLWVLFVVFLPTQDARARGPAGQGPGCRVPPVRPRGRQPRHVVVGRR